MCETAGKRQMEGRPPCRPEQEADGTEAVPPGRLPQRSRPAHPPVVPRGNRSIIVFVTVCTDARKPILAQASVHSWLRQVWAGATAWSVGRYILMPDHVHFFCAPAMAEYPSLKKWTAYWKSIAAARWPHPEDGKVWERDCWDTQLRRDESYAEKWAYVRNNPVRAGLVAAPDDWPFQGEMKVLRWHDV